MKGYKFFVFMFFLICLSCQYQQEHRLILPPIEDTDTTKVIRPDLFEEQEPEPNDFEEPTETFLNGTKWKLVGIVDIETGDIRELQPKDCEYCYTLTFYSDFQAIIFHISDIYGILDLSPTSLNREPRLEFPAGPWFREMSFQKYEKDGKDYDIEEFRYLFYYIKSFTITPDEFKLFYYIKTGSLLMDSGRSKNYILFKIVDE